MGHPGASLFDTQTHLDRSPPGESMDGYVCMSVVRVTVDLLASSLGDTPGLRRSRTRPLGYYTRRRLSLGSAGDPHAITPSCDPVNGYVARVTVARLASSLGDDPGLRRSRTNALGYYRSDPWGQISESTQQASAHLGRADAGDRKINTRRDFSNRQGRPVQPSRPYDHGLPI